MRTCSNCGGEGGFLRVSDEPGSFGKVWKRCEACYGFGLRSDEADRWFRGIVAAQIVASS